MPGTGLGKAETGSGPLLGSGRMRENERVMGVLAPNSRPVAGRMRCCADPAPIQLRTAVCCHSSAYEALGMRVSPSWLTAISRSQDFLQVGSELGGAALNTRPHREETSLASNPSDAQLIPDAVAVE